MKIVPQWKTARNRKMYGAYKNHQRILSARVAPKLTLYIIQYHGISSAFYGEIKSGRTTLQETTWYTNADAAKAWVTYHLNNWIKSGLLVLEPSNE